MPWAIIVSADEGGIPNVDYMTGAKQNDLIALLYRAVDQPDAWERIACDINSLYGVEKGLFGVRNVAGNQMVDAYQWNIDEKSFREYEDYYYSVDVFTEKLKMQPMGHFYANNQFLTDKEFLNSEVYDGFGHPNDIRHIASSIFTVPGTDQFSQFVCIRGKSSEPYDQETLDRLAMLVPHLKQVIYLRQQIQAMEVKTATREGLLDSLTKPVFVCRSDTRLIYSTAPAVKLASESRLLDVKQNRVSLCDHVHNKRLKQLIHNASDACKGRLTIPCGAVRVEKDGEVLEILVRPMRYRRDHAFGEMGEPAAAVYVRNVKSTLVLSPDILRELYGLTPSEVAVTCLLAQGLQPQEIAGGRKASIHTVRAQIRSTYRKTQCNNQLALISKLLSGIANIT